MRSYNPSRLLLPRTRCAPLPLVGRGWGWGSQLVDTPRPTIMTPTPRADARDPPHKGEGRRALLAMRPAARADPVPLAYIRLPFSHSRSRSRGAFLRPGFWLFASLAPIEGWRSAESRRVLARH